MCDKSERDGTNPCYHSYHIRIPCYFLKYISITKWTARFWQHQKTPSWKKNRFLLINNEARKHLNILYKFFLFSFPVLYILNKMFDIFAFVISKFSLIFYTMKLKSYNERKLYYLRYTNENYSFLFLKLKLFNQNICLIRNNLGSFIITICFLHNFGYLYFPYDCWCHCYILLYWVTVITFEFRLYLVLFNVFFPCSTCCFIEL